MRVKVLVAQPCLTLCNTMDCSPAGSSVHGILQARILESSKNTRVGSHSLLQGIFPIQGWNLVSRVAGRFSASEPLGKPCNKSKLLFT